MSILMAVSRLVSLDTRLANNERLLRVCTQSEIKFIFM